MSRSCSCPVPTSIANIGTFSCPTNVGQIQKLVFQRQGQTYGTAAEIITAANWTTLLAATDGTHVVITPYVENPTNEPGGPVSVGGGNETRDGIPRLVGTEPTKWTFRASEWDSTTLRALKELPCEDLTVGFINENGYWVHTMDTTTPTECCGFPIQQLHISDRKIGGFQGIDYAEITFYTKDGWDNYMTITDPTANFNALDLHD